jgi:hypothetical protein
VLGLDRKLGTLVGWTIGVTLPGADPDPASWLTAGIELVAAVASLVVMVKLDRADRRGRLFWATVATLSLFLSINKELDGQSSMTAIGRRVLEQNGWLDFRNATFLALTCLVAACAVGLVGTLRWLAGPRRYHLAWVGVVVLLGFTVLRTAAISHLDPLGTDPTREVLTFVLEAGGAALVAVAAVRQQRLGPRATARTAAG